MPTTPRQGRRLRSGWGGVRARTRFKGLVGLVGCVGLVCSQPASGAPADPAALSAAHVNLAPGELLLYSTATCPYCQQARNWLRAHDIPYTECDVQREPHCADELQARGGRGVPHFAVRGHELSGFSAGSLERLLSKI